MGAVAFVALAAPTVAAAGLGRSISSSLAPSGVSFHSVGGSKLGPSLNPNCGLSVQLGADELAPGRIDALAGPSAFNGTGSFSVTDARGDQRCFSLVAPLPKLRSTERLPVVVCALHGTSPTLRPGTENQFTANRTLLLTMRDRVPRLH